MTEDIEHEEKPETESKSNGLAGKFWGLSGHFCFGIFLVIVVRIGMSFMPNDCIYYDEHGAEIVQLASLHKGYARQIGFRKKQYKTQNQKAADIAEKLGQGNSFGGLHTCAELPDGKIFIAGDNKDFYDLTDDTWICDPKTNSKSKGPKMPVYCISPTLTTLKDGRVLISGGFRDDKAAPVDNISIFDPTTNKITQIGHMLQARADHTALQINSHQVIVAGGKVQAFQFANPGKTTGIVEIIDINTGKSKLTQMTIPGSSPFLIRDDNKDIYVIGGFYATATMGDTRWHRSITKLDIPHDQVD